MSEIIKYSKTQKLAAIVFYIAIVIALIITIGGAIYTIADLVRREGKMQLFQELNIGFQIAIVSGLIAGLLFLLVLFYGLYKKGVRFLLKSIYKERRLHEKFKNRKIAQILTVSFLLGIFAVIIGFITAILYEMLMGVSFVFLKDFSNGQLVLLAGITIFIIIGLIFLFNYIWHNGYYLIIKLIFNLEETESE